jgi:predicted nuclease with TOPRIM domain
MNNKTRKDLREIAGKMDELAGMLEDIKSQLEDIQEQEQDKYGNLPEQLQDTENGQRLSESADNLYDLVDRLDSALSELWDISEGVEQVTEI